VIFFSLGISVNRAQLADIQRQVLLHLRHFAGVEMMVGDLEYRARRLVCSERPRLFQMLSNPVQKLLARADARPGLPAGLYPS
jgi:hypothetical protein